MERSRLGRRRSRGFFFEPPELSSDRGAVDFDRPRFESFDAFAEPA